MYIKYIVLYKQISILPFPNAGVWVLFLFVYLFVCCIFQHRKERFAFCGFSIIWQVAIFCAVNFSGKRKKNKKEKKNRLVRERGRESL